jgi:hypothetical protein
MSETSEREAYFEERRQEAEEGDRRAEPVPHGPHGCTGALVPLIDADGTVMGERCLVCSCTWRDW